MKRSEAIRLAVDRYLSPIYGQDTYQLCHCIDRLQESGDISDDLRLEIKNDILKYLGSLTMSGAYYWEPYEDYKYQAQDLRFMFAEFLALMWEDEEAAEEEATILAQHYADTDINRDIGSEGV